MSPAVPAPSVRPDDVLAVLGLDPAVHPYGIADVAQLWERSRWWVRDGAVVGMMQLPGSPVPVGYAVAAADPAPTLSLLADLVPVLPDRFLVHAAVGALARLAGDFRASWHHDYVKMALGPAARLPAPDPRVRVLGRDDAAALGRLFATDAHAGDFFHVGLLDTGHYVGIDGAGGLDACAGVHVVDRCHRVAAIGNVATHPARRRLGLGRAVVATLCHRLRVDVDAIGLNVRRANPAARRLYEQLGFTRLVSYVEAELIRTAA